MTLALKNLFPYMNPLCDLYMPNSIPNSSKYDEQCRFYIRSYKQFYLIMVKY